MNMRVFVLLLSSLLSASAQNELSLVDTKSGIKLLVVDKNYPMLRLLLPNQSEQERGIEIEFPEHVSGLNVQSALYEHLYLESRGNENRRTLPEWTVSGNTISYRTILNGNVSLTAEAQLDSSGIRYTYTFTNHSNISYNHLQAVTCVKLYSAFSDTLLERTYVHHNNGFDLLASETPERLTMRLDQWLPCRYLVSFSWPLSEKRIEKDEDSITRYNKSRKVDLPVMATLSHDRKWVVATFTQETGNLWTNPERSCQHADPETTLNPNEIKALRLATFVYKGTLDMLFDLLTEDTR